MNWNFKKRKSISFTKKFIRLLNVYSNIFLKFSFFAVMITDYLFQIKKKFTFQLYVDSHDSGLNTSRLFAEESCSFPGPSFVFSLTSISHASRNGAFSATNQPPHIMWGRFHLVPWTDPLQRSNDQRWLLRAWQSKLNEYTSSLEIQCGMINFQIFLIRKQWFLFSEILFIYIGLDMFQAGVTYNRKHDVIIENMTLW